MSSFTQTRWPVVDLPPATVKIWNIYIIHTINYKTKKYILKVSLELKQTRPTWLISPQRNFESESYIKLAS